MHQSGGKIKPFLRTISPNFSIIYSNSNWDVPKHVNKALSKSWILGYFKWSKH